MNNQLMPSGATQKAMMPSWGRALARAGRGGDTMLAHISRDEAKLLASHGGAWSINPRTALPEFTQNGGSADSGAGNSGAAGAGVGQGGGGGGGGGDAGGKGDTSSAGLGGTAVASGPPGTGLADSSSPAAPAGSNAPASGPPGTGLPTGGTPFASGIGNDTTVSQNVASEMGLSPDQLATGAQNLSTAVDKSYTSGPFSSLGNFAASLFGIDQNLVNQPFKSYVGGLNTPSYGIDPAALAASAIGTGLGVPGMGTLVGGISDMMGNPLERGLTANPQVGYGPHGSGMAGGNPW